jgi:hypothetical protein
VLNEASQIVLKIDFVFVIGTTRFQFSLKITPGSRFKFVQLRGMTALEVMIVARCEVLVEVCGDLCIDAVKRRFWGQVRSLINHIHPLTVRRTGAHGSIPHSRSGQPPPCTALLPKAGAATDYV